MGLADLETFVGQVWSPDVRLLAEDAWRCYNAGAIRACIAATWTAVTADIITKLVWLADDGDNKAVSFRNSIAAAQSKGLQRDGVRAMQSIESSLLANAVEFELIDSIGLRELERIREDRNLCVHPSLRTLDDVYEPRPEVARGHLAVALTTLLIHPPVQGRKVVSGLAAYIDDPSFVPTVPYIQATFFDRVRSATKQTIVNLAAKHAVLEIDTPGQLSAADYADRMAVALDAFAQRDRESVRAAVAKQKERFRTLDGATQLRTLGRLGDHDYFWSSVDRALATRLLGLLDAPSSVAEGQAFPRDLAAGLAVVRSRDAREGLPGLEQRFEDLPWIDRMAVVIAARPDPYFLPSVLEFIKEAWSFRTGEQAGRLLIKHAPFLTVDILATALENWCTNVQCRRASEMPEIAVRLLQHTAHLGQSRAKPFAEFLSGVQEMEEEGDYYSYPALEAALVTHGYLR
ncbi:hypothetical protein [Nocardia iowensis]|uniref:hypothetical protein n=1 Tax=Nocardia iowensis TaxID=204891 RepID=UPI001FE767BB|nr:hypothetical protein [Nocardia iowensis]